MTNQLPDFADDTSVQSEKLGGFRWFSGAKTLRHSGVSGYDDLEKQDSEVSPAIVQDTDDDFEYRGVSNSNNLDSVFRSSGNTTGQTSEGQLNSTSPKQHSRYNSIYNPLSSMPEAGEQDVTVSDHERSSEYDDELLFTPEPHTLWQGQGEELSNNLRLRFTEEI